MSFDCVRWHVSRGWPRLAAPGADEPPGSTFLAWGVFNGVRWKPKGAYGSYGINAWNYNPDKLNYNTQSGKDNWCWRSINVKDTGHIPLLLDANWIGGWPQQVDEPPPIDGWSPHANDSNMGRFCINRHNGWCKCRFFGFFGQESGAEAVVEAKMAS